MKAVLVFLLAALVVIFNDKRSSAHPVTSTEKPVGVTVNFFFKKSQSTPRSSASAVPNSTPVASSTIPALAPLNATTVVNGTRENATTFQDPTCALSGDIGCIGLCRNLGFPVGICDAFGLCACS